MLKFDIFSLSNETIKKENLQEVKTGRIFIRDGEPDPEGLASYEIFGDPGTDARKFKFGYIRLGDLFVHPHVVFELKFIKRKFMDLVYGRGYFKLTKDGDIIEADEDEDGAGTGPRFLYKIWDNLDFDYKKEDPSSVRYVRKRFLFSVDKKSAFMDKVLVIPAFYRDVDMVSNKKNEVNVYYQKLINNASTIMATSKFSGVFDGLSDSHRNIMDLLIENYYNMIKMFGGRKGFIHKKIMSKKVDYSARMVITANDLSETESPDDMPTSFMYSRIPLFAVTKCFAPFMVNAIREIIEGMVGGNDFVYIKDGDGFKRVRLAPDWKTVLTSDYIHHLINLYDESVEHRLDAFKLPLEDGTETELYFAMGDADDPDSTSIDISETGIADALNGGKNYKTLRLIHIFYMAAVRATSDKHVLITRFPIDDHNNTYPSKINIVPYKRVGRVIDEHGTVYKNFPILKKSDRENLRSMFIDSLVLFPAMLAALNADFDGDTCFVIGLFTKEANADADKYLKNTGNMVGITGDTTRKAGTLVSHIIHVMSY